MTISGCSQPEEVVRTVEIEKEKPKLNLPPTEPIETLPVEWQVINREKMENVFVELEEENKPLVIYGLDQKNYENLSINIANFLKLTKEQKNQLDSYRRYYENSE